MYEKYALLDAQITSLEKEQDELRSQILTDMVSRGVEKEKHSIGSFTISKLKKWTYSVKFQTMSEKLKSLKAKEESMEIATYVENPSLRFTVIKI